MQYIYFWTDALHNIKIYRLNLAQRGAWAWICLLAGECDKGGRIEKGGKPLSMDEIADSLHIKSKSERKELDVMIEKMIVAESLVWNDGHVLVVTNFRERNPMLPPNIKDANSARVKLHREREKQMQDTRLTDGNFAEYCKIYESNIGLLAPLIGEQLKELSDKYSSEWFKEAVKLACSNNVRRLSYISAILDRWKIEGYKSKKLKQGKKETSDFSDVPVIKSGEDNG